MTTVGFNKEKFINEFTGALDLLKIKRNQREFMLLNPGIMTNLFLWAAARRTK